MTAESSALAQGVKAPNRLGQFARLLGPSLRAHALLIALVALFLGSEYVTATVVGGLKTQDFTKFSLGFIAFNLPILLLAVVVQRFYYIAVHVRPRHPTLALARDVTRIIFDPARAANALPLIVALSVFIGTFSFYKTNIPVIVPFHWDQTLSDLDRLVHFGRLPWQWLQPVLGFPVVTFFLNIIYNLWFFVMWTMWVGFALRPEPSELRTRFFLSFIFVWAIGGSLLAIGFSSAGPCYFTRLGLAPDPYQGLMAYLNDVAADFPLWAIKTQDLLWSGYLGEQNVVTGISAMPSMHNASTLLFALAGWKIHRNLGIVLSLYAALIFLASIHLGWHYAIDGYLGYAVTLTVWGVSGPIARWHERQAASRRFAELARQSHRD